MMKLSTSTYYYKPKISRVERAKRDAELRDLIEAIHITYPRAGYRTIREYLFRHGMRVNWKRIRRVMCKYSLHAQVKRRFIRTTDSEHDFHVYPNLLPGTTITDINQVWVADITYIRLLTGFVYLAVILDVFSRRVVGWSISKSLNHQLTLDALEVALERRNPEPGLIHHSDRGVQYACNEYVDLLKKHKIQISMSAKGNPYDNAFAESFIKTLKYEEVYLWEYESIVDVLERIPHFIDEVYNKKRVHSGIKYLPPEEFEEILMDNERKEELGQMRLNL